MKRLKAAGVDGKVIPIRKFNIREAFREKDSLINYKMQLEIQISGKSLIHEFYVVESLVYPMVIGIDMLSHYKAALRYKSEGFESEFTKTGPGGDFRKKKINAININEGREELSRILEEHPELFRAKIGCITNYEHRIEMTSRRNHTKGVRTRSPRNIKNVCMSIFGTLKSKESSKEQQHQPIGGCYKEAIGKDQAMPGCTAIEPTECERPRTASNDR